MDQRIAPQGSPRTPTARIAATTPRLIVRILNSVFFKTFKNFKLFSNFNEVQTYSLMMIWLRSKHVGVPLSIFIVF